MPYRVILTTTALKDLDSIDQFEREKILKKIEFFKTVEKINAYSKKLENSKIGDYKLRVGNYRLIYDSEKDLIIITKIDHRKDIYK
jgi:mRNA interferase RelE/StbE